MRSRGALLEQEQSSSSLPSWREPFWPAPSLQEPSSRGPSSPEPSSLRPFSPELSSPRPSLPEPSSLPSLPVSLPFLRLSLPFKFSSSSTDSHVGIIHLIPKDCKCLENKAAIRP